MQHGQRLVQLKQFAMANPGRSVLALLSEAGLGTFTPFSTRTGLKYVYDYLRNAGTVTTICILIATGAGGRCPSFAHRPNVPRGADSPESRFDFHSFDQLTFIAEALEENPAEDVAVGEQC